MMENIILEIREKLHAHLKINKPGLTLKIIKNGSIGLAEAYMDNCFKQKFN